MSESSGVSGPEKSRDLQGRKGSCILNRWPLLICPLGLIWCTLLNHLHIEWSINPQYGYGWAVPFLSLYLAWRELCAQPVSFASNGSSWICSPSSGLCVLAALWLPIRLLQEANPEWRLVSWALALEVIGFTLALLPVQFRKLRLPLLFMLVAVPWPSVMERPLIQELTCFTAQIASEVLNLFGWPALQRGNLVEVCRGTIGIEEACSGIRSLQAAVMVSSFFCLYLHLKTLAALSLVGAGFLLAIALNIVRTTLLAVLAATKGMNAVAIWHGPAGWLIPLTCFVLLCLCATFLARRQRSREIKQRSADRGQMAEVRDQQSEAYQCAELRPPTSFFCSLLFGLRGSPSVLWLAGSLVTSEIATELWYRSHEFSLPEPVAWTMALPREATAVRQTPLPQRIKQALRFDEALKVSWEEAGGRSWQLIYVQWKPGRIAARLAKDHTPAICLSAEGRDLLAPVQDELLSLPGLRLRGQMYTATDPVRGKVHILFCLREDRSSQEIQLEPDSLWQERVAPVFAGRRNCGMRSLELALWGIQDNGEARSALREEVRRIVCVESTASKSEQSLPREVLR